MKNAVKADLHIHTIYSDGLNTPLEYIEFAELKGIKIISITDHNTFRGSKEALKVLKEHSFDIVIIPGAEIRTDIGDVLVYCPDVPEDKVPNSILELFDWAKERNCILVPAHPLDIFRHGIGLLNLLKFNWKVVEVYNGGTLIPFLNELTYAICKKLNVSCIGNSDAHHIASLGMCYTLIDVDDYPCVESVLQSMVNGYVKPHAQKFSRRVKYRIKASIARRILRTS